MSTLDDATTDAGAPRRRRHRIVVAVTAAATAAVAALAVVVAVALGQSDDDVIRLSRETTMTAGGRAVGSPIADVELTDSAGRTVQSATLVGQPLVINFWYSSCPPCERELPAFATVERELRQRIRFVGINPLDSAAEAARFAARAGVEFETLFDRAGNLSTALSVVGFPTTVLVDETGVVVFQHTGELDAAALRAAIDTELLE